MQNYRNHAMPYGAGYPRCTAPAATTDRCPSSTSEAVTSCKDEMVLAMAYVKWQTWQKIYDVEKALHHGTIFQELDLPFGGTGGCQK